MRIRTLVCVLLASTAMLGPCPASADPAQAAACHARIERIDARSAGNYLPFSDTPVEIPLEVALQDAEGCTLGLSLRSEHRGQLAGDEGALSYRLRDAGGRGHALDGTSRVALARGGARMTITATVEAGQAVRAGRYTDRLAVQLLDGERVLDEREVELRVPVPSQASVSVGGSAAAGFSNRLGGGLDFGELRAGKEREAFVFVLANAAYALRLSSAHAGRLRHVEAADTIGYTARLDGRVLDLSGTVIAEGPSRGRWLNWPPYRLGVRIGEVEGRRAGEYRDTITIDVLLLE